MEEEYIEISPEEEAKQVAKRDWQKRAYNCSMASKHNFIPIEFDLTAKSKTVTKIMCTQCFNHINIMEAMEHRN